ncbi:MAG: nucleotidyltransferase domain-containing protein [Desulfobulbaceae bacterium]|nr:nucleotidyltransferase domain-containing protein [Desulfobulbaceae bacterium]
MDKKQAYEIARKYTDFLRKNKPGITKVYIFGSCVKGTASENSDIDLAIVFDTFFDSFDMQVELMKLRRNFDTRIEPHPFKEMDFNMSNPFANEILNNGIEMR